MNLVAKSGVDINQIKDRINKGFSNLEIQLTSEFVNPIKDLNHYSVIYSSNDWDVQNIHMPLTNLGEINLEYFGFSTYSSIFFSACKLAQETATFYNHPITLVIHCGTSLDDLQLMPDSLSKIEEIFYLATGYYPDVLFSIENLPPCYTKNKNVVLQNTAFSENVDLANYFNKALNTNCFYTAIDISSNIISLQKLLNFLAPESNIKMEYYSLDWYFKQNKNTINNIHLNNMRGLGLAKMHHGASFDEGNKNDIYLLNEIIQLYKKYDYNCNITLEVDELNYFDIKEAAKLKELIEKNF